MLDFTSVTKISNSFATTSLPRPMNQIPDMLVLLKQQLDAVMSRHLRSRTVKVGHVGMLFLHNILEPIVQGDVQRWGMVSHAISKKNRENL